MPNIVACPSCGERLARIDRVDLSPTGRIWRCDQGHSYDEAREGYVNLLLAQYKRSREPGYGKDMLDSRRRFFNRGHYEPLADEVANLAISHCQPGSTLLDAGCGEGYYLRRVGAGNELIERVGVDISKPAIRLAAKADALGTYIVGGAHRLPLIESSVDALLSHFSPISPDDFSRVIRPGGILITGGPGALHLHELKELFYDDPHYREANHPYSLAEHFEPLGEQRVAYRMQIEGVDNVRDLVRMTPFYWSVPEHVRSRAWELDSLDTQVDVIMRVFRRQG